MKYILNYSHPLSDKAKQQLIAQFGEIFELIVACQVDFEQDIQDQLSNLVKAGHQALFDADVRDGDSIWQSWPDLFVPPALSFAAVVVGNEFLNGDGNNTRSGMIVLKASTGVVRQFELSTVIYR